jgi:hypothetical protein
MQHAWGDKKCIQNCDGKHKGKDQSKDLGTDEIITLKLVFKH